MRKLPSWCSGKDTNLRPVTVHWAGYHLVDVLYTVHAKCLYARRAENMTARQQMLWRLYQTRVADRVANEFRGSTQVMEKLHQDEVPVNRGRFFEFSVRGIERSIT